MSNPLLDAWRSQASDSSGNPLLDEWKSEQSTASVIDWATSAAGGPLGVLAKAGRDVIRDRASSGDYRADAAKDESFLDRSGALLERGAQSAMGGAERAIGTLTGIRGIRDRANTLEEASNTPIAGETTWDDVKKAQGVWATLGAGAKFGLETSFTSLPEMAITAMPGGIGIESMIQTGRIAQERAQANGEFEADRGDLAIAAPFGVGSAFLERAGIDTLTGKIGSNIAKNAIGRVGVKTAAETATEALQSGIEYTGGAAGTDKGWDAGEAGDQMFAGAVGGAFMGGAISSSTEVASTTIRRVGNKPVPRGVIVEAARQEAVLTPADQDSPLDNDLLAEGLAQIGAGAGVAEADRILSEAGMPAVNRSVTVKMPDGRRMTGTVVDAFQTDAGEFGSSGGIKVRLNDGSLFEEHFDDIRERGMAIEPTALTADEINAKMRRDAEEARARSDAAIAVMEMPAPAEAETAAPVTLSPRTEIGSVNQPVIATPVGDAIQGFKNKTRRVESGGKDNAKNPRSSAEGRYQFTDGTWKATYRAVYGNGLSDAEILAKKFDPATQEALMDRLTRDNAAAIGKQGFAVTEGNLYLAHFAGSGGATALLRASPNAPVESVLGPKAVAANPFLKGMSASEVIAWAAGKMGSKNPGSVPTEPTQAAETIETPYVDPYAKGMAEYAQWEAEQRKQAEKQPAQDEVTPLTPEAQAEAGSPLNQFVTPGTVVPPPTLGSDRAGGAAPVDGGAPAQSTSEDWVPFKPETGTLDVPRDLMPQIKSGDRSSLVQFLRARGVESTLGIDSVPASSLKPTQREFSPAKVAKARDYEGGNRAILVSSDGYVLDGHHQWLAALEDGQDIRTIQFDAPIDKLLATAAEMPSVTTDGASPTASAGTSAAVGGTTPETAAAPARTPPQTGAAASPTIESSPAGGANPVAPAGDGDTPNVRDLGRDDGRFAVRTGAVIKAASGRALAPAPKWDDSSKLKTNASLKRQRDWLLGEARTEAASRGNPLISDMLNRMNPKNMAPVDWSLVNETLFDNTNGPDGQAKWSGYGQPAFGDKLAGGMPVAEAAAVARKVDRSAAIIMDPAAGTVKTVPLGTERWRRADGTDTALDYDTTERHERVEMMKAAKVGSVVHGASIKALSEASFNELPLVVRERIHAHLGKAAPVDTEVNAGEKSAGEAGIATQQEAVAPSRDDTQTGEGEPTSTDPSPGRFANNKIFTEDRVQAARDRLKAKLNRLNSGLDPELAMDGMVIAGAYIEDGVRRFADVARALASDLGVELAALKPYLRAWYNSARDTLEDSGHSVADMDGAEAVRAAMSDFDAWAREPATTPTNSATEGREANTDAELPNRLPAGDARSGPGDVQRTAPQRTDGTAPRREDEGGAGTVQAPDARPANAPERGAQEPAGRGRGDRAGLRDADRLPAASGAVGRDAREMLVRFASGMSRVGDLNAGANALGGSDKTGIGVDVGELTWPAIQTLARAAVDWKTKLFVDSGAFSLFRRNLKSMAEADKATTDLFERENVRPADLKALDFNGIMNRYDAIMETVSEYDAAEEIEAGAIMFVMPDIVGNQQASIDLVERYQEWISAQARSSTMMPIVPIQKGDDTLSEAYDRVARILGTKDFIVGIPSNEKAVSTDELTVFLTISQPKRIHFLGAVSEKTLGPKLDALQDVLDKNSGYSLDHLSADANILRSTLYKTPIEKGKRSQGVRDVLAGRDAEAGSRNNRYSEAKAVTGTDWTIEPGSLAENRSFAQKARDNVDAIALVKAIEAEGRPATKDEQETIARYVGWGGIKNIFPAPDGSYGKGFEELGPRLRALLTDEEYETAQRSIQYAHYTGETVVRAMWDAAARLGFTGGSIFEPGMGTGNFRGMMPASLVQASRYAGLEYDHLTASIARLLYPESGVRQADYTRTPQVKDTFDLVIGNPPFSETAITADPVYGKHKFLMHDFFFAKSLDAVKPGGLLMFVTSAGTLNKRDAKAREYLAERADLVGAIRLPGNAFEKNAGTSVTTDIVILRKRLPGEKPNDRGWVDTVNKTLPDRDGAMHTASVNAYFDDHADMILGEQGFFDKLVAGPRYAVRAPAGFNLGEKLSDAIGKLAPRVVDSTPSELPKGYEAPEIDFASSERKDGSYYLDADGKLMQYRGGVGRPVQGMGKGVTGGMSLKAQVRVKGLIPVKDALREVYAADVRNDDATGLKAREKLNAAYDTFVKAFGPINKTDVSYRRPSRVEMEGLRAAAREEARLAGSEWDDGSYDIQSALDRGLPMREIAAERDAMREAAVAAGRTWNEGDFDPEEVPDKVIEKRENLDPFMEDEESYRLAAIEVYNKETGEAAKGRVFFENAIRLDTTPQINSADDALMFSLNRLGRPDLGLIAEMAGKAKGEVLEELGDRLFELPGQPGTYATAETYLSGNVREKLATARAAAEKNPALRRNVTALEAAQPTPLTPTEIAANLGMPWIPPEIISKFVTERLGLSSATVKYQPKLATWTAAGDSYSAAATTTWGTSRMNAMAILEAALNRQTIQIYDTTQDKKRVLNAPDTQAAQDKQAEMKAAFKEWVYSDETRAADLVKTYNENYNSLVAPKFDGAYLTTPGIASDWKWRPHQRSVIARIIQAGNTYMAHEVGAGKTSAMIGAGMEMKRLGLVNKPMYVVPNHMLGQFTKEFFEQYPLARIRVADETRFHTSRRKEFVARMAADDLDAVIITHSAFGFIGMSDEFQAELMQQQIDDLVDLLAEIDKGERITRRKVEQQKEALEQRVQGMMNRKRDQVFTFEETGVDFLFVDEAHLFRKLDFATKMSNVKGIDPNGSQMSFDLYAKTRWLEQQKPGRNLVLASGTPITNTMAELYSISRYLQEGELAKRLLSHFDAWAGAFGDTVTSLEQNAAGGYQPVTRFAQFVNVPELSVMVRQVMDVVGSAELRQYVSLPNLVGGERVMQMAEQTPAQEDYQAQLAARMEAIKRRSGPPQKGDDILLSVIGDGRKAAIDYRLIDASAPKEEGSKLELMIDKVAENHKAFAKTAFHAPLPDGKGFSERAINHGPATQMIFSNFGINGDFPVHKYIKQSLIARGIPANQIALISEFKSHVQKQRLFNDMNEGKVRVLIGSVAKMGTGVNAQRRLRAVHNMDAMWYPADDTQRNGRIMRQGNLNPEVEINDYATKGTYDSTMWAMMGRKAKFIEGFMRGDPTLRDMEDLGEASQYEQAAALTTADPRIMDLTEWKQDLEKLNRQRIAFERGQHDVRARIAHAEDRVAYATRTIPLVKEDIAKRALPGEDEDFTAKAGGKTFTDRAEFGAALQEGMEELVTDANGRERREGLGELAGFPIIGEVHPGFKGQMGTAFLIKRSGGRETEVHSDDSRGLVTKLVNRMRKFESELADLEASLEMNRRDIADYTPRLEGKFDDGGKAAELKAQIDALEAILAKESQAAQATAAVQPDDAPVDTRDSITDPDRQPDADAIESDEALWDRLDARLGQLKLDPLVELAIRTTLSPEGNPGEKAGQFRVYGKTDGTVTRTIIAVAMDSEMPRLMTLDHEAIHAMRFLGLFTDSEWSVLARRATGDRALWASVARRYSKESHERQVEEAVAEMFAGWAQRQRNRRGAPLGAVERAFARVAEFFRAMHSLLHGQGFTTPESVMRAIDAGRVGARPSNAPEIVADDVRYAVADATFANTETEKRWQEAKKGMQTQEGLRERLTGWMDAGWSGLSRHWINLPNTPRFASLQQQLRKLGAAPQVAKERTVRMLNDMVKDFERAELDLFTRKVVLDDLSWEVAQEHDLPFGFTPATLKAELDKINAALEADPDRKVWNAVMKRKIVNKKLAQELVDAGVLEAEQIRNPTYYRHQVLEYARAQQKFAATPGGKLKAPIWAKRMGSTMDINANLLEAEFDWLNKAFVDIEVAKAIDWIKESDHNIVGDLKQQARAQNKAGIDQAIADAQALLAQGKAPQDELEAAGALVAAWKGANQRLGMGFSGLKAVLQSGVLTIPRGLQGAADSIENGPGSGDPPFALLNWILDNNLEGSIEAATIYKGIGLRNQIMRSVLGKAFIDPTSADALVKKLAPEGYATWQPEEGKLLFTAKTLPEHAIDGMIDELKTAPPQGIDREAWIARLEKAKSTLVVGGDRYTMILPQEVVDTLNQLRRPGEQSLARWLIEKPVRMWKQWILINPRRWAKYNINNMIGDLDAILAGNPKLLRRVPEAARELYGVMKNGARPTPRYEQAIERGVFDSGVSVQEIPDIHAFSAFAKFGDESKLAKFNRLTLGKAWNALQGSTQFRENVFRYAAYLDYVDRIEGGEAQRSIGYGASLRDMVDAVDNDQDRAALLARDLIGDYGAISHFGGNLRNTLIPFWSWMEINTKRYKRLLANAFDEGFTQGLRAGSIVGVGRGAALSVQMAMIYGVIQLWNHLFWPDEEDELGEQQARQLHIILGKTADGEVITLRTQGAMSDALSWLGLGQVGEAITEYERGRGSIGEILVQPAKATANKLLTSLSPVISVPLENAMGKKFWPDIFNPTPNRDPYRNIASTLSLDNEYDALASKPSRGYGRSWQEAILYRRDPGEIAYNESRGIAYDWLRRVKGQDGSSDNRSPRSTAMRDFRTAVKFGDEEAAEAALQEMGKLGVTNGDFNGMIKRAAPLNPIAKKDRARFIEGLSESERETFVRAERWYRETFLPEPNTP